MERAANVMLGVGALVLLGMIVAHLALQSGTPAEEPVVAVDEEVVEHLVAGLRTRILGGLEPDGEILRGIPRDVEDELGHGDRALETVLLARARALIEGRRRRSAARTEPGTNAAIDAAFAELNQRGVIAIQGAGYTMSDGWSDVAEEAAERPDARGAAFYHGQDLERAVEGDGLLLAFGSLSRGDDADARTVEIGREVCEVLARHGVATEWEGTAAQRIRIPPFEWSR